MSESGRPGPAPAERHDAPEPARPENPPAVAVPPPATRPAGNPFLSHLQSLRELQITLSQEGKAEAILGEGTAGTVEIVGADFAVAQFDPSNGMPSLRFGWIEGRQMAQHEIAVAMRRLDDTIQQVRRGKVSRIVLGARAADDIAEPPAAADGPPPPETGRGRMFGTTLVLGMDAAMGSRGVLVLARHDPLPFDRAQVLLADILATVTAIQIERALRATDARRSSERLQADHAGATQRLQETALELQAINAIAGAATPSLDLDRQMEIALTKTLEVTRFRVGAIFLEDETGPAPALRCARAVGEGPYLELAKQRVHRRGEGVTGRVWDNGQPLAISDLSVAASFSAGIDELLSLRRAGYRALACVPLRARGRVIGVMELLSTEARPELESRPSLAEAIAAQIAIVIQNARLLSDILRHSMRLEGELETASIEALRRERLLHALADTLAGARRSNDTKRTAADVLERCLEPLGMDAGTVHLVDAGTRVLQLRAQKGLSQPALDHLGGRLSGTIIGRALETAEPVYVTLDPDEPLDAGGLRLRAAVPLRSLSGVHGVLAVASRHERALGERERTALAVLGDLLGLVVENARVFRQAAGPSTGDLPSQLVQAQKMESVGVLAGGIAHEFNNILGAILGYAGYIQTLTSADNPIHRQAITIERQTRRAAELTQQLLAFARGGPEFREPLDLNRSIADTVSFVSKSLDPGIEIETRPDPDLPQVEADKSQMQQVLVNLAVNAAEAMPEGGRITFETRVAHLDESFARRHAGLQPGDHVEVVVQDTGTGMPPEVIDRLFEPFFTSKTDGRGTGLGLSVVYGIVRSHGGCVSVGSTRGLGTTVRLYLPVFDQARRAARDGAAASRPPAPRPSPPAARAPGPATPFERVTVVNVERRRPRSAPAEESSAVAAPPPSAPESRATPPVAPASPASAVAPGPPAPPASSAAPAARAAVPAPGTTPKGRVLVVDDEGAIREMARDILQSSGYEVVTAIDGVDALDVFRREWGRIDLVLLDVVMPRLGGVETFRRLYGMDPGVRVLFWSGIEDHERGQKALREGALGLLSKPFSMIDLVTRVDKVLGRG